MSVHQRAEDVLSTVVDGGIRKSPHFCAEWTPKLPISELRTVLILNIEVLAKLA